MKLPLNNQMLNINFILKNNERNLKSKIFYLRKIDFAEILEKAITCFFYKLSILLWTL